MLEALVLVGNYSPQKRERERDGLCGASVSTLKAQFSEEFSMQNAEKLRRTLGRNCSDLD